MSTCNLLLLSSCCHEPLPAFRVDALIRATLARKVFVLPAFETPTGVTQADAQKVAYGERQLLL